MNSRPWPDSKPTINFCDIFPTDFLKHELLDRLWEEQRSAVLCLAFVNNYFADLCAPYLDERKIALSKFSLCLILLEENNWPLFCRCFDSKKLKNELLTAPTNREIIFRAVIQAAVKSGDSSVLKQFIDYNTYDQMASLLVQLGQHSLFEALLSKLEPILLVEPEAAPRRDLQELRFAIISHSDDVKFFDILSEHFGPMTEPDYSMELLSQACELNRTAILTRFSEFKYLHLSKMDWLDLLSLTVKRGHCESLRIVVSMGESRFSYRFLKKHITRMAEKVPAGDYYYGLRSELDDIGDSLVEPLEDEEGSDGSSEDSSEGSVEDLEI